MSSTQRTVALFCLGFALLAPSVTGSPGPSQHIIFTNETAVQVGVTPNGTNPNILAALAAHSPSMFTAAGGVLLNASASQSFSVQAGTHTVLAADMTQVSSTGVIPSITESQSVSANQTVNVYVKPLGGAIPDIQFSATP
jgi:hypothetical protein